MLLLPTSGVRCGLHHDVLTSTAEDASLHKWLAKKAGMQRRRSPASNNYGNPSKNNSRFGKLRSTAFIWFRNGPEVARNSHLPFGEGVDGIHSSVLLSAVANSHLPRTKLLEAGVIHFCTQHSHVGRQLQQSPSVEVSLHRGTNALWSVFGPVAISP